MTRFAPQINVQVIDGAGNTERVTDQTQRVLQFAYTDSEKQADKLALTINNQDLSNFDDALWAHGNRVRVTWGYDGQLSPSRECVIVKVTGFTQLKIEARAKSVLMDRVRRARIFENMTRAQVVQQVAAENGWATDAQFVEDTKTVLPFVTQAGVSDAQLLRRLAHQEGFEFFVDYDGLHFHERRLEQRPLRKFIWYSDPDRGDILDIQVTNDITRKPGEVKVKAKDPVAKTTEEKVANNDADANRAGTAEVLISGSGLASGVSAPEAVVDVGPSTQQPAAADREAKSKFRRAQRATAKLKIIAVGDPQMLAKTIIQLDGVGQRLGGLYYVREVAHAMGVNAGYTMTITCSSDGHGGLAKQRAQTVEEGLPEASPEKSKAKVNAKAAPPPASKGTDDEPGELIAVPVPIRDSTGAVIGESVRYEKRQPPTVTLKDGSLSST